MTAVPTGRTADAWLRGLLGVPVLVNGSIVTRLVRFTETELVFQVGDGEWVVPRGKVRRIERLSGG